MKLPRLAAIDVGTNSIRCIVVEVDARGKYRVLDDEKATVRLGEGLSRDNAIGKPAWERTIKGLLRMKQIADGHNVVGIETAATSVVRRASNGADFVAAVARETGLDIRIISGEEEAELAALSAFRNFNIEGLCYAMADIGGGSVEVVTAVGTHIDETFSLEIGAVVLSEQFRTAKPDAQQYAKLRRHVARVLASSIPLAEMLPVQCLIGSGGTMTSVASMIMASRKEEFGSVHGYEVLRADVVHLLAMLQRKDAKELRSVPGLNPDRADIIVAGVTVVDELMAYLNVNLLRINERGIREGLVLDGLKRRNLLPAEEAPLTWRDSVLQFARSCHYDEPHSHQVARLSLDVFETLAPVSRLTARDRQMLEAAALLHDVGYFINYSAHHKHTYHLIRHAELFDFTARERELTAQIARYHRKALPRKKHDRFMMLAPQDRRVVKKLAGILRFADGLDRRRNCAVTGIACSVAASSFVVRLQGEGDLSVELFGAKTKADLFELAFEKNVTLLPPQPPSPQQEG